MAATYNYFCDVCRQFKWVNFVPKDGSWMPHCCWVNHRLVWSERLNEWVSQEPDYGPVYFPITVQAMGHRLAGSWRDEQKRAERMERERKIADEKWRKEMDAWRAKEAKKQRLANTPKESTPNKATAANHLIDVLPQFSVSIWWKYLKAELISIRDLNRKRDENLINRQWSGYHAPGREADNKMIRGGVKRYRSCRAGFQRIQKDYCGDPRLSGSF